MKTRGARAVMAAGFVGLSVVAWVTTGGAQNPSAAQPGPAAASGNVQTLRERAAAYWAARMAGDAKTQWELLEPRGRGRLTPQEYSGGEGAVRYVGYQVEDATVYGYFATVRVRILFQPILPLPRRVPVQAVVAEDKWIRIGGVWYHRLDDEGREQPQEREP